MYSKIETPLNAGAGPYLHQATRSKKITDTFSGLRLSISYEKVTDIEKDVANAIFEKRDETMESSYLLFYFPIKDHSLLSTTLI